ncbi:phenol hydroxylase subunit P4 [Halomonas halocynthiae]|uniref:phenol hydroxylase subunit P4 n=1 Tax=Halomonas halocynthiae TaxID=176290 RepID=UPI000409C858|nr:phenol hydroxylase subunit P4 [Halomonas halocynthiae]
MTVNANYPNYQGPVRDRVENFHGNQLVYVMWERHLLFCAPLTFLADPNMSFSDFLNDMLHPALAPHPESQQLRFDDAKWRLNGEGFAPRLEASLINNGIDHKSQLRLITPCLSDLADAAI